MKNNVRALAMGALLLSTAMMQGQATEASINKEIQGLGSVPDAQRSAATTKIAGEIRALPTGQSKVKLADALMHLAVEGDGAQVAMQAAADTLAQAVKETPQPPAKDGKPAMPYMDLAKLVRYGGAITDFKDPMLDKASEILAANDADIQKADFTLKDLDGKKVTLSQLRGKIVLINFWSTSCIPCRKEMPNLDVIDTNFQQQGLVMLSITDENPFKVSSFLSINGGKFHPTVLIDDGDKIAKMFHVDGPPRTFVFDRDGKLVAQSIGSSTQRQFFDMLTKGGLHP